MFRNFREYEEGAVIDTDLCIIGAGAAGITIAREYVEAGREVLLLESGDLEPEPATLDLNKGSSVGEPHPPLEVTRLRFFGGTTNHWDGHCRPLDPIDFEKREWVPHSGWPITFADLEPFYARAQPVCELGPYEYAPEDWAVELPGLIAFDPQRIENRLWQFSPPTRFGTRYREELERAESIHVLFNANVVEIVVNENARTVREVAIKSLDGKAGRVRPRTVVLAGGGIENPRILLASKGVMSSGLGNAHDHVGRYFMEHPHALIGFAVPEVELDRFAPYYGGVEATIQAGTATLRAKPGLSEAVQRAERLPNACVDMGYGFDRSTGYLALRETGNSLLDGRLPDELGDAVLDMVSDLDGLAAGVYRRLTDQRVLWFGANTEQVPNPESRVTLAAERDAVGVPRPKLDWQLTMQDKEATRRACRMVGEELARLGIGRMRLDDWLLADGDDWQGLDVRYHHMGTTRMSDDPKQGVVDADCRVHGIDNLYIAGSSVFPTSGYANPTLTIVAMAIRLADHLRQAKG